LPVYKLIRYHRLTFDSIADGALRWTYLPWIESITHVKTGEEEHLELRLNSDYEKIWRTLKQRLDEPGVRLKSQYSIRLYQWAKPYLAVGYKRVSIATLRKILGLEEIKDNSGRVIQEAPLELWANLKQRALDVALKEINKQSDIRLELEFTGRGSYRKVLSLGFRITARKYRKRFFSRKGVRPRPRRPRRLRVSHRYSFLSATYRSSFVLELRSGGVSDPSKELTRLFRVLSTKSRTYT
jgi:hypothetical protein